MGLDGDRTFLGFGFGAIQAGLFLYEAFQSGNFRRLVVAEVVPAAVKTIREADGHFSINVAHATHIENATIGSIEIEDPSSAEDRQRLVKAIVEAEEIATAVPSVQHYVSLGPGSLHRVLAEGLRKKARTRGPRAVIYAAENHNHAAEILQEKVFAEIPAYEHADVRRCVTFLNTVIGKMSGSVGSAEEMKARNLATITPGDSRAFLVESFNRILISRIENAGFDQPFRRGITVFEEKDDLLPFEHAKLYGHNATHALAAYVAAARGVTRIAELADHPDIIAFLRAAFIGESGKSLIRLHAGTDALFTGTGYEAYADDLLVRMMNPYLCDTVERVGRDVERKLGWDDRLVGTMRVALGQQVDPRRYAFGVATALETIDASLTGSDDGRRNFLGRIWEPASPREEEKKQVLQLVADGCSRLREWHRLEFPAPEAMFCQSGS